MDFSDKKWVQIGLNWVRFHFLNWVRLVFFVFLTSVTLDPIGGYEERREAAGHLAHGDFSMATWADREVF